MRCIPFDQSPSNPFKPAHQTAQTDTAQATYSYTAFRKFCTSSIALIARSAIRFDSFPCDSSPTNWSIILYSPIANHISKHRPHCHHTRRDGRLFISYHSGTLPPLIHLRVLRTVKQPPRAPHPCSSHLVQSPLNKRRPFPSWCGPWQLTLNAQLRVSGCEVLAWLTCPFGS